MSDIITVNPYYLLEMLGNLSGLADHDESVEFYRSLDPNDEDAVRKIIRAHVVPHVKRFTDDTLAKIKLTMRYYLSCSEVPWDDLFCSVLPPFEPPKNARDYFVWAWEECFPGEDYRCGDVSRCKVVSDLTEANRNLHRRTDPESQGTCENMY
jgi:hypothetical protein